MAYSARNIIMGAAALFFTTDDSSTATYPVNGVALPAPIAGTKYEDTLEGAAAWRHAGYTSEGLELSYEPDYTDVEVDQLLDSAKIFKTSMRASINTTLVEAQLENLLVAWGQGREGADGSDTFTETEAVDTLIIAAGELGDEPTERGLVAVGPAPRSPANARRERIYYARRCLSVDSVSVAVRRDEATMFPVSFRLLPEAVTGGVNQYGTIRDRNIGTAA